MIKNLIFFFFLLINYYYKGTKCNDAETAISNCLNLLKSMHLICRDDIWS